MKGYAWIASVILPLLATACSGFSTSTSMVTPKITFHLTPVPEITAIFEQLPTSSLTVAPLPPSATPSPTVATSTFQQYADVYANRGWQDTGIFVTYGDRVTIQYISGEWTHWLGRIPYSDASGKYGYVCADSIPASECVEPIPDFPTGALIGRVGNQLLRIGNLLTFTSEGDGYLLLRINDADTGLYDNAGIITVQITVHRLRTSDITIPTRTPPPKLPASSERTVVNVYVMIFDPEVNGRPLTQNNGFADPHPLMDNYIRDIERVTGGSVVYRIAQESVIRTFPAKMGGFVYTGEQYWACVNSSAENAPEYCRRNVDYRAVVNTRYDPDYMSACEAVANGGIDEVWEWEGGWFGFREYYTVAPNTLCPGLEREFTFMTFNYSRGVAEMLHSMGHRVENVLQQELGTELWDRFDGQRQRYAQDYDQPPAPDARHPEVNAADTHCGNVHFPPNAYLHYQYNRDFPVQSDCDGWLHYPNLNGSKTTLNCDAWGCDQYGFLRWWLTHIPHNPGASNGIYHNWWKYVFHFGEQ